MSFLRTRIQTTALLAGLGLFAAACGDSPTESGGGGRPAPQQPAPQQPTGVASVEIAPDTFSILAVGGHRMVQVTARGHEGAPVTGRPIAFASSNVTVATVDASGNVTGHQVGRAWITVTVDGRTAQARVDVVPVTVDSVALGARWMEVQWGTRGTIAAIVYAADGRVLYDRPVTWTTSDSSVAVVDVYGQIHGIAGGRAWITATSEGKSARAEVIVPAVKVMQMRAADGGALPGFVRDTVVDEGGGNLRRMRVQVVSGTLSMHSRLGTYEQRVTTRVYERRGSCTEWGSCIWSADETVQERLWTDHGLILYNAFTGEPIFESTATEGLSYYAQDAPAHGLTVWQGVPGTGIRLPYLYGL
jgi:hypothetical protein